MKVFVAGATGALGHRLVPDLVTNGHDVVGTTRGPRGVTLLEGFGAKGVVVDGLDRDGMMRAVTSSEPEVVIHEMTALAGVSDFKHFDDEFALTNRLRTEGLDYLLAAAREAGARRIVAQSFGNWNYERSGAPAKSETDRLDPNPPAAMTKTLAAIEYLESKVLDQDDIEGVALRYSNFYGPGGHIAEDGAIVEQVRKRRMPILGNGAGIWSFIHYDDAAAATRLAMAPEAEPGVYNVTDDEPAPVSVWLPELAKAVGAKPPRRLPTWVGKLVVGDAGVSLFTKIRGASNAKAKAALGWQLKYPSWRDGFRHGLAA
jgi:nucleoside-diphosphate-sugar epimerase